MRRLVVSLSSLALAAQIIMTPIPEGRLVPERDNALVWPIKDEPLDHVVDRWLTNYCYSLPEACEMPLKPWAYQFGTGAVTPKYGGQIP